MHLWEAGSYPIALIILFASVFVPILQIYIYNISFIINKV